MRIPSKISAPERAARSARVASGDGKKASKSGGTSSGASVSASVSTKARSLANDAGIDVAKVERLRELIESGEFTINYQAVAEGILQRG